MPGSCYAPAPDNKAAAPTDMAGYQLYAKITGCCYTSKHSISVITAMYFSDVPPAAA